MTKEELNRLPTLVGTKQILSCLGISHANWYRKLKKGSVRHPMKFGSINKWKKEYIFWLMDNGFEQEGTYPPYNEDDSNPAGAKQSERPAEATVPPG